VTESPRINWWPPIVVVGLVVIGLNFGWERAGHALGALGVIGGLLLAWDGVQWLRRRDRQ
jgi:threonine/homoserine/homoserine lactone efflux protein